MTSRTRGVPVELLGPDGAVLLSTTTDDLATIEQTAAAADGPVSVRLPLLGSVYTLTEFLSLPMVAIPMSPKNGGSSVHRAAR